MIRSRKPGYGLRFESSPEPDLVSVKIVAMNEARLEYHISKDCLIDVILRVNEDGTITQNSIVSSSAESTIHVDYTFDLGMSVNRASYGQLTEGGPIPIPASKNALEITGDDFYITNSNLVAQIQGSLNLNDAPVKLNGLRDGTFEGVPVSASLKGSLELRPRSTVELQATFCLRPKVEALHKTLTPQAEPDSTQKDPTRTWRIDEGPESLHGFRSFVIRRNLEYILGACTIPVSATDTCLITDHVALPLGWNRDN